MADFESDIGEAVRRGLEAGIAAADGEISLEDSDFDRRVSEAFQDATSEAVPGVVACLKRDAAEMLAERREGQRDFERRLAETWGPAFDIYEMLVRAAYEAGDAFHRRHRETAEDGEDVLFAVMVSLHARACRIAEEVLALMKAGFGQGAQARWRALHEVAVVASFLRKQGQEGARRYLLHEAVESWRAAEEYRRHESALGYSPLPEAEVAELRARVDELCNEFGPEFEGAYGWAASLLRKQRCGLKTIEQAVGMAHYRPHYRMASHGTHANAKGITFTPDVLPGRPVLLAGPGVAGLADPGHGACLSLVQTTVALLAIRTDYSSPLVGATLLALCDEAGDAFLACQRRVADARPDMASNPR